MYAGRVDKPVGFYLYLIKANPYYNLYMMEDVALATAMVEIGPANLAQDSNP